MRDKDEIMTIDPRSILNANLGVTNIIERSVIRRDMGKVTDSIFEKLKDHYGPYSSFAGLDANKPLEDTVFTKDGANIIHAIQYSSKLEDWVRRAVEYIGKNMETAAGDGTTSSMMFTCGMLKFMSKTIDDMRPINYNILYRAWNNIVDDLKDRMQKYVMTPKNEKGEYDPELVYNLAYAQAYTSSHGNEELAAAVAKIFKNTPPKMWNQMTFKRRHYEALKLFDVHSSEHQFEMKSEVFSKTVYNRDAGRYLEYPNATLIVVNARVEADTKYWNDIKLEIENSTEENPVALVCWNDFDNNTFSKLMEMLMAKEDEHNKYHFAVFGASPAHPRINDFTVLQSVAGANVVEYTGGNFDGRPFIKRNVYVKYEFELLQFDNLYVDENHDSEMIKERPYYTDKEHPFLREWAETIAKFIEAYESADLDRAQQRELKTFKDCYNKLVYDKEMYIVIGGKTFDNLAMFDVVQDVIKATVRSMDCGMVISNNKTLYTCVCELIKALEDTRGYPESESKNVKLELWLATCIRDTLSMFSDVVMDQLYPYGKKTLKPECFEYKPSFLSRIFSASDTFDNFGQISVEDKLTEYFWWQRMFGQLSDFSQSERDSFREWWFSNSVDMLSYDNSMLWGSAQNRCSVSIQAIAEDKFNVRRLMIVQPANADIVMLERFGELALKFILTERVIVEGTAYLNKEKKK